MAFRKFASPGEYSQKKTNALFSYQGRPTIFGTCSACAIDDEDAVGQFNEVLQYQAESDEWVVIGSLMEERTAHEVVEVPASFCNKF